MNAKSPLIDRKEVDRGQLFKDEQVTLANRRFLREPEKIRLNLIREYNKARSNLRHHMDDVRRSDIDRKIVAKNMSSALKAYRDSYDTLYQYARKEWTLIANHLLNDHTDLIVRATNLLSSLKEVKRR